MVLVHIRSVLPSLPPAERRIAQAILADPVAVAGWPVTRLAAFCDTSTTSVVRLCRRLGYTRHQDLRLDLTRESARETLVSAAPSAVSGDIDQEDTLTDIVAKVARNEALAISDTASALDVDALGRAVAAVSAARRIDVFGVGASAFVGLDLQQKLIRIGRTALTWPDSHSAWTSATLLDSGCVAIGISHTGQTADTLRFLSLAAAAGATTVAISNHAGAPVAEAADIALTTAARETRLRPGALGSRIAQLMVIDCLFTGVAQASYGQSIDALRQTYAAVHGDDPTP
ncbi:MurR/RpiR family transcriptional regulator [Phytoactinopolyspora alkaliphila]|uniref:MurR/RpiR family transcriptional regulator n=2 Tax=Phytoactinopolyspora alkaliphila TaxID=1783498 RepID=A0A6N9YPQ3_9ACTN|nr:MurR/RpiR family transcriptional regulator [Phytoactinopolyspora alkaliphila]NED96799.1 MurR/RpiR family transcriptional regulator [Phytoactinopolyspora alkaliphila]